MDNLFLRFAKKINLKGITRYEGFSFKETKYSKETDILTLTVLCPKVMNYSLAKDFLDSAENAPFKIDLHFEYLSKYTTSEVANLLKEEFLSHPGATEEELPRFSINKNVITLHFFSRYHKVAFDDVLSVWEDLLNSLDLLCEIETDVDFHDGELEQREEKILEYLKATQEDYQKYIKKNAPKQVMKGEYQVVKINEINDDSGLVEFTGKIFQMEVKVSKKGKKFATIFVCDDTYAVEVIAFSNLSKIKEELLDDLAKKMPAVKIRGYVQRSTFNNELQVRASSIDIDETFVLGGETEDTAEEKRTELHLHTKMSTMDGVATMDEYCKQASKWGMKAIAVTDHGVVQAFPEAQKAGKQYNMKILYGSEINLVDEHLNYIFNPSNIELLDASYVVFDFETTGLSARYDRIIEFGAVKYQNGRIVDSIDIFVDPEIKLPKVIVEKTHITDQMLMNQLKIKPALEIMRKFIGDSILVAHNASFDYGFLNEAFKNNQQPEMKNPVIDTLALAWYMFPDAKSHSLGGLCRQFQVRYDDDEAHRANYDAEVLNSVWQAMLGKLTAGNIHLRHADLDKLTNEKIPLNARVKHAVVFAKNPQGLKDLFKVISYGHINCFNGVPRVPRRVLDQYRENFLIGSACFNGEVFEAAMTRSKQVLQEKMSYYDYIEVQPLANYTFLVNDGQVSSMDKVQMIVKDIINAADELGKKVVATSDCHYVRPYQKQFRDVYIFAKAVGGVRHPLNPHRRDNMHYENPDQHLRSTSEMLEEFAFLGEEKAKEIVIKNSNAIADMIEPLYPVKDKLYPPYIENVDERLVSRVYEKAHRMYGDPLPQVVENRLKAELSGIIKYGYSVQFFIASEIVRQANKDGFIVGSRGSVGSSFVATMADITEVNALPPHYLCPECKHIEFVTDGLVKSGYDLPDKNCPCCGHKMKQDGQNLPFATFLGFNAEKVPDIDLNFSGEYQARAHELTKVLLGADNVYRAGTIETVAEKTAFGYVSGYYEALGINPKTIPNAERTRMATFCKDVKRTTGQHPGGIIVIPAQFEVYDFTPIQYPADDLSAAWKTTHFDFHAIHDNVLKLDLLGHVDPTALKMLGDITKIDPRTVPMNDQDVISIFNSRDALKCQSNYLNETTGGLGIPEFGTALTRSMLEEIRPKTFADLVLISGLSHGTDVWAGNAQELLHNKVCGVEGIIACRDDVMLFLQAHGVENSIAFKTMEAVRKGKKIPPEYMETLKEHKIPEYYIESANKCKYLFPKAHAIAYVTMAVRIAWYKVHKPLAYYATFFSTRSKQYDIKAMVNGKQAIIRRIEEINALKEKRMQAPKDDEIHKTLLIALEMCERGYKIENIDLYRSHYKNFVVDEENNAIIPPFIVIDGLGEGPAESVVKAREERRFSSKEDLSRRTKLNSQNIEKLKNLGVLEGLPDSDQLSLFDLLN